MTACRFYSRRAAGRCQDSRIQLGLSFNNTCHRHELPPPAGTGAASSVSNDPDRLTALTASTHGGDTLRVSAAEVATPVPAGVNAMPAHFAAGSCAAETQTVHQKGSRKTAQAQNLTTWTGENPQPHRFIRLDGFLLILLRIPVAGFSADSLPCRDIKKEE